MKLTEKELRDKIDQLQFELKAADKENELLKDVLKEVLLTFEDNEQAIPVTLEMKIDKVIHLTK